MPLRTTIHIAYHDDQQFGVGSRTCLGKNISLMEMSKLIPQIVRDFDFQLESPHTPWRTVNWWLVKQTGLRCKVCKRLR